jgi:diadenosine tetraphosphate (Ap4A) HIT family hydrolase
MNNGAAAGQIVFHAHVHIIPRYKDKTLPKKYTYKEGEAAEMAKKIGSNISNS